MKKTEINKGFIIFLSLICLVAITLEMINGRFWLTDFQVYYSAAHNFLSAGAVYHVCFDSGSGFYKYSPVILFFFIPYTLLSYKIASVIHFTVLAFALGYTYTLLLRILKKYFPGNGIRREGLLLSLSFIGILVPFTREMHLGNINILILLLSCQAVMLYIEEKPFSGSLLLGLVVLAKPFYLLLILPLILRKQWKAIGWLGAVLAAGSILPFFLHGIDYTMTLYSGWFSTMIGHSTDYPGMSSLGYLIRHNLFPTMPGFAEYVIIFLYCGLMTWFITYNKIQEEKVKDDNFTMHGNFFFEWILMLSFMSLLFRTDWVLLLLTAPLITFIVFYISQTKRFWLIPILVIFLFFYGANSDDLLGKGLSGSILRSGLMGLGNFCIVILALILFLDFRKMKANKNSLHE